MAGIFAPTLQSDVSPVRAVETPSAVGALANVASDVAQGFFRAKDERERLAAARAPSYTERKDTFDQKVLSSYTNELTGLYQTAQEKGWSSTELARRENNLDLKYLGQGLDTSSSGFKAAKTTVTGKPVEDFGRSDDQVFIESVQSREGGEGLITSARLDLVGKGLDPNDPTNVAASLRERETKQAELNRLRLDETLSVAEGKVIFTSGLDDLVRESETALTALTASGAIVPAEAIQNQYLQVKALEQQANAFLARNPNATDADKAVIEQAISRAEAVFEVAGVQFENGEFRQMGPVELQQADRLKKTIAILRKSPETLDNIIAAGLTDGSILKDPAKYAQAESRLNLATQRMEAMGETEVQPDWITENNIIVSNSLMKSYSNLVQYQTDPDRTFEKASEGAVSLLGEEEKAKWSSLDNTGAWTATKAFSSAAKITGDNVTLTPRQAEATFNNLVGLSLGFERIDINSEAVSFDGVRKEVSADLPKLLSKLKQADPTLGTQAEEMLFRSLVGQKLAYDQRIKSDEAAQGVVYNPATNTYNFREVDTNTLLLRNLVAERYGNDIEKLRNSGFTGLRLEDVMPSDQAQRNRKILEEEARFSGGGMSADQREAAMVDSYVRSKLPDKDVLLNVADLRNSSVYLSNLSSKIEPTEAKEARELAQETADALRGTTGTDIQGRNAVTVTELEGADVISGGSVTAQLIDKYESGRGGYRTLFRQAQEAGKPFEGYDVTTKTLGELYEFSNPSGAVGTYGAYVKANNPKGDLATPMGRYQFIGTTLRDTAKRMNLPDSTVFTPDVQDAMFLFLARDAIEGKSQEGKRKALRGTWDGFNKATDTQLNQMISEIESGNPDLGGGAFVNQNVPPAESVRPQARPSDMAVPTIEPAATPVSGSNVDTGVPLTEAELAPESAQGTEANTGSRGGASDAVAANTTPPEVQALIQAMTSRPLTEEEKAALEEYLATIQGSK